MPPSPPRPDHQDEFDAGMIDDVRVICTSDEPDQELVRTEILAAVPCTYANHTLLGTVERHGHWLPTVLDAAILARGVGFVGTGGARAMTRRRRLTFAQARPCPVSRRCGSNGGSAEPSRGIAERCVLYNARV